MSMDRQANPDPTSMTRRKIKISSVSNLRYVRTITHWAFLAARTLDHNFKSKNSHFQLSGLKHCFQQEKEGEKEAS